jgi:hypothetical protein
MAGLFERYRSAHHPDQDVRLPLAARYLKGEVQDAAAARVLRRRDRLLRLEMESSSLAGILIEPLSAACPDKKFILTVRDVYTWCDSWIDHNVNDPPESSSPWTALDRIRLRVDEVEPTRFDSPLIDRGLPPLACYFHLWAEHNSRVLEVVPPTRLLVVETSQILAKTGELAVWAGGSSRDAPHRAWVDLLHTQEASRAGDARPVVRAGRRGPDLRSADEPLLPRGVVVVRSAGQARVTAPSLAEETSAAYFASTPDS